MKAQKIAGCVDCGAPRDSFSQHRCAACYERRQKASGTLTDTDLKRLATLGQSIATSLSCDANGTGVPCRTDRLQAVKDMTEYLRIHDLTVKGGN